MNEKTVVGLYIRVSTQEQASEGYSIEEQKERLTKYADAQDWTIYRLYSDPGFSGGSIERPGLKTLIADVVAGKLDKVAVYKLDRMSRSQKDTLYLIEDIFLPNGVDFVSMTENFDTGTPLGRAMIGILSVFAQLEREQIKERMSLGREGRAKSGLWHGSSRIPVGYLYENGQLKTEPFEAEIVRRIYREFNNGRTVAAIVADFRREGITTKYGRMQPSTVRSVIRTKTNIGVVSHNGVEYQGQHDPIISREEYDRANQRLDDQAQTDVNHYNFRKYVSPITGLCYCAVCQSKMMIQYKNSRSKEVNRVITCLHKGATGCNNPRYPLLEVESYVIDQIKKLRLDPEYFKETRSQTQTAGELERIEILEERIKGNDVKVSRLMDLYSIGGIDLSALKDKIEILNLESTTLRSEVEKLRRQLSETLSDQDIQDLVYSLEETVEDPEQARIVVKALVKRIEFQGQDISIYWNF